MINVYSSHRLNQEQDWNPFGRGSTKAELWRFEIGGLDRRAAGREAWSGPFETSAGAAGRCLRLYTFPFDKLFLLHITIYKWANALVPPTPFSGQSGGERSKRPTCAVVQTCKYYRVFEGLGSVNIDCGTMNRMYWYQGFPWLFMECCFHILGMVCLASLA